MKANSRVWFGVGLFVLALTGLWHFDSAFGQQGGGGFGGGGGGSGGAGGFRGAGFGTAGSVAANADFVYVLQQHTLTQLSAKDLTEVKRVTLQPAAGEAGEHGPRFDRRGAGGGGGAGGQGGGGRVGGGQGGAGGGFGSFGSSGSVAANADYVYVLQDNRLTQFSARDLTLVKQTGVEAQPAVK